MVGEALCLFFISFGITFCSVYGVCFIARSLAILDIPDGAIKQHKEPTPYLGGVAVYAGCIAGLVWSGLLLLFIPFVLSLSILLCVGLIDDMVRLSPLQKFGGQGIAVIFFFVVNGPSYTELSLLLYPIFCLWALMIINAFNLVDIMDGLSSSIGIGSAAIMLVFAVWARDWHITALLISFLGCLTAFLWHNYPPAKLYLGDAGALLLGGFFALIPFLFDKELIHTPLWYSVCIIALTLPLFELFSLIIIRFLKGIPFYRASPDHFALNFKKKGWSIPKILLYVHFFSLLLLILVFFLVVNYEKAFILLMLYALLVGVQIVISMPCLKLKKCFLGPKLQ